MITASNGAQYDYDALDQRVVKTGGSNPGEIIYFAGKPIALHDPTSGAYTDLIYANGQMIAEVAGTQTATPMYRLSDHLGSLAAQTDNSGTVTGSNVFLPFGELLSSTTADSFQFTGLPQDTENSTYHAGFRNLSTLQGRWLSPDPYNGSYDVTNPQSFNRYAYVMNNPLIYVDPSGLINCSGGWSYNYNDAKGVEVVSSPITCDPDQAVTNALPGGFDNPATWPLHGLMGSKPIPNPASGNNKPQKPPCSPLAHDSSESGIDTLVDGVGRITQPLSMIEANAVIFISSGAEIVGGAAAIAAGCGDPTPLQPVTCTAGIAGGGAVIVTGGATGAAGVYFFENFTLPAIKNWGC